MTILRQSTQIVVRIGPFLDATDAVTPETGITLGAADQAEALKAAGAATVDISGATWAAVTGAGGWYDLTLTTSHTDTIGELVIVVQDSSVCLPVFARFQVVEETVYDALYASSAPGYLQPTTAGRTLDVSAGGEAGIDWANVGSPTTTVSLTGTTVATTTNVTNLHASAATAAELAKVPKSDGTVSWNATALAAINAEADTAISDASLATAASQTTITNHLTDIKGATWATTDTLEAIRDRGDAAWVTATGFSTHTAADVRTEMDANSTQLAAIVADTGTDGVVVATASKTGYRLSATGVDDILDEAYEGTTTLRQWLRLAAGVLFGKSSGHESGTPAYRNEADSADRVTATTDANGNRTSVSLTKT